MSSKVDKIICSSLLGYLLTAVHVFFPCSSSSWVNTSLRLLTQIALWQFDNISPFHKLLCAEIVQIKLGNHLNVLKISQGENLYICLVSLVKVRACSEDKISACCFKHTVYSR